VFSSKQRHGCKQERDKGADYRTLCIAEFHKVS
jgi:hypothetical protein